MEITNKRTQRKTGRRLPGMSNSRGAVVNRISKWHLAGAVAAAVLLAGCDVKDSIYNTSHPDHGTVTLTADWSGIGEGLTAPASYTVKADDYTATVSGATNLLDHLFEPGKYTIYAYNTAEHITVSGTTATVEAAPAPTGQTGTFVRNTPGWLFASVTDAVIEADKEHAYTAMMKQQVRELTLIIEPTGETTGRIESITGTLSGVAASLDIADGTHGAPSSVELQFEKITGGANAGKYAATVRLLGTAGARQELNARLYFTDDSPAAVTLTSDLTTALAAFNADKRTPLTLGGSVVETPTGAGFSATITDWTAGNGDGEDIDANM
nr:FimB/Mfa2 family fimbrial subunit [Parabacteroides pacaensis]